MSILATYKQKLIEKISQASTVFHTNPTRVSAINEALEDLTEMYDIPDLIKRTQIAFTAGVTNKPTDYFRMVKLFTIPTSNNQPQEYTYLIEDLFDNVAPNSEEFVWTEDYDISTGTRRFFIKANNTITLQMRYIRRVTLLVDDLDESGLQSNFDDVVAYWAGYILLRQEGNYPKATEFERKAKDICLSAIQSRRKSGGVKQGERLRSRFEKYPLLNPGIIIIN